MTVQQVADLPRVRTERSAELISTLSDEQLEPPTPPPRSRNEHLAGTIERVPIGHDDRHRCDIEAKLRIGA